MATDDGDNRAGSVSVDVVPNPAGFETKLRGQVLPIAQRIGQEIAREIAAPIAQKIATSIANGLRDGGRAGITAAARAGAELGGAIGKPLRDSVAGAISGGVSDAARAAVPQGAKVGETVGETVAKPIRDKVKKSIGDGLDAGKLPASEKGTEAGAAYGGRFAEVARTRIAAALKALPAVNVDADTTDAELHIAALRAELADLHRARIGVDIDEGLALAQIELMRERLHALGRESASIQVRVDAGAAEASLAAVAAEVRAVSAESANINVGGNAAGEVERIGSAARESVPALGGLVTTIVTLLPAAIPVAAAVAAAVAGIGIAGLGAAAGIGVGILALSRIVAAVKDMSAAQTAANTAVGGGSAAAYAYANALDQAKSAQASYANTVANAADAQRRAAESVANAETSLADAQRQARQAQVALTQARVEAAQAEQDLNNQVRDGAIAREQAQLDLERAQAAFNRVAAADPTSDVYRQAKINLEEARQRVAELGISQQRLVDQQRQAQKSGIDGSSQVTAAQQGVRQAAEQVARAEQALADARIAQAQQARQAAYSIAQAQQGIVQAQRALAQASAGVGTAAGGASAAATKLAQDMAGLSPEGRRFATFIFGLRTDIHDLQGIAEKGLLPGAQEAITNLLPYLPQVKTLVGDVSSEVGRLFVASSHTFTNPFWHQFFAFLGHEAVPALDGLEQVGVNVATMLAGIVQAGAPLGHQFGAGLIAFTGDLATESQHLRDNPAFQEFLADARREGPEVARAIGEIVLAAGHLANALNPIGEVEVKAIGGLAHAIDEIPVPVLTAAAVAFIAVSGGLKLVNLYIGATKIATIAASGAQSVWNTILGRQPALVAAAATPTEALAAAQTAAATSADALTGAVIALTATLTPATTGVTDLTLAEIELAVSVETLDAATAAAAIANEALGAAMTQAAVAAGGLAAGETAVATTATGAKVGLSTLTDFLGGPWGIALGVAALALTYFASQSHDNTAQVQELTGALGNLADAYHNIGTDGGQAVRDLVRQNAGLQDLILNADKFGVSLGQINQTLNGDPAAAAQVNAAYQHRIDLLNQLVNGSNTYSQTIKLYDDLSIPHDMKAAQQLLDATQTQKDSIDATIVSQTRSKDALGLLTVAQQNATSTTRTATPAQIALANALTVVADASSTAAAKVSALRNASDTLYGATRATADANEAYQASIDAVKASIDQNKNATTLSTQAGRNNTDAIKAQLQASNDLYFADIASGVATDKATKAHDARTKALIAEATQGHLDHDVVKNLVDIYGQVPTDVSTKITVLGASAALTQLQNLEIAQLALRTGLPVDVAAKEYLNQRKAATQVTGGLAEGGPVRGPGTKTSDSVPIWASAGEFMQPAHAVDYYGTGLMEAIRLHTIPREMLQGLAGGGQVWPFVVDASKTEIPTKAQITAAAFGGTLPAGVLAIQSWIRAQAGKPYVWDSAGPVGYDCSGILSAVSNLINGRNPYSHTFSTSSEGAYFPLPGWGLFTAGWAHPGERGASADTGHTAGNLAGLAFESRGGAGVVVGSRATPVTAFAHLGHYGTTVSGGGGLGSHPAFAAGGLVHAGVYDQGGYLPPGLTLAFNGTGRYERVTPEPQREGGDVHHHYNYTVNAAGTTVGDRELQAFTRKMDARSRAGRPG